MIFQPPKRFHLSAGTLGVSLVIVAGTAAAGPYGYDLHNVLMPRSAGMAGTSLARPQDAPSAIFGNPGTLTQFKGTEFTFGATLYDPSVKLKHDGSVTGGAFSADSDTELFPVPIVGITQDLAGNQVPPA